METEGNLTTSAGCRTIVCLRDRRILAGRPSEMFPTLLLLLILALQQTEAVGMPESSTPYMPSSTATANLTSAESTSDSPKQSTLDVLLGVVSKFDLGETKPQLAETHPEKQALLMAEAP